MVPSHAPLAPGRLAFAINLSYGGQLMLNSESTSVVSVGPGATEFATSSVESHGLQALAVGSKSRKIMRGTSHPVPELRKFGFVCAYSLPAGPISPALIVLSKPCSQLMPMPFLRRPVSSDRVSESPVGALKLSLTAMLWS